MKALIVVFVISLIGNFAMAEFQSPDSNENNIVEVPFDSHEESASNSGRRSLSSGRLGCAKDTTRSYRSGKFLHYEWCSPAGRWVSAGTRRVKLKF